MNTLEKQLAYSIALASTAHINQFDKGGKPYILHVLWVMNKVRHLGIKYMIVAVLHDIVEDTKMTIKKLEELEYDKDIVEAIDLLTKKDNQDYENYILNLMENDLALQVKLRDLEHNSRITRMKGLEEKDFQRLEKYFRAYKFLKKYKK